MHQTRDGRVPDHASPMADAAMEQCGLRGSVFVHQKQRRDVHDQRLLAASESLGRDGCKLLCTMEAVDMRVQEDQAERLDRAASSSSMQLLNIREELMQGSTGSKKSARRRPGRNKAFHLQFWSWSSLCVDGEMSGQLRSLLWVRS